ncbi:four helix bundle protein [Lysinibacillus boronitolerans]|uniref:four helix bundle protein n=1 Tax=Lysinibacillus boronitolerans TaxID=309788 RepID=UPI00037D9B05|nr:four helix bundle protein [Lysinibacillus boronitolerans]
MALKKQNIGNFRELNVYRKALIFNKQMNTLIDSFPAYEKNNLSDQLRRASTSVCANLAEGCGNYYYKKEFDRLNTAIGSLCECRAFLDIATMLGHLEREEYHELDGEAEEILKMLIGMAKRIEKILEEDAS